VDTTFAFSRYRRYHGWGWGIGGLVFAVIIVVAVSMSIRYTGGQNSTDSDYAPGDTRIVSHSSIFCQSLTLRDTSSTAATLYLLREKPQLTGRDSFTVPESYSIDPGNENHLYYYLYPGSQFSVSTCLSSGTLASFYLIKGTHNFNKWSDDASSYYALHHFDITSLCSQGRKNYTFSFSSEDQYYFVLYNPNPFYYATVGIEATFTFDRVLYQPVNSTIVDSCQAGGQGPLSCTRDVPYQSNYTALIVVDSPPTTTPEENISIDTSCGARVWIYVVITVVPVLFVALCIIGIVVACVLVKKRRKKVYEPLNTPPKATANLGSGNEVPAYAPPPFNPGYGTTEPPPEYSTVVKQ